MKSRLSIPGAPGFTLTEMLVSLGIILLITGLAVASLLPLSQKKRGQMTAARIVSAMRKAKWLAITEGAEYGVGFRRPSGGNWSILLLKKRSGEWIGAEAPVPLSPDITDLRLTGSSIKEFNPNGTSSGGSVIFAAGDGRRRRISLSPATGRIFLHEE